jgi:uncharacterized protein (TIGR02117 family)
MLALLIRTRRSITVSTLCIFCAFGGCTVVPAQGAATALAAPRQVVYVIAGSWHTEIALPRDEIEGGLARLAAAFPSAPYLIFGWGARDFYMAANPGVGDLLRAAVPGPAVMLVIPLGVAPTAYLSSANAWRIAVSPVGAARLSQFLWESVARNPAGEPIRAGAGPTPQSVFYAANGTYDAADTCNTWTARALHAAGLPVSSAGVVFTGQVVNQLKSLPAAGTATAAR